MKLYEISTERADGIRGQYAIRANNFIQAQKKAVKAYPDQFPNDWKATVKWQLFRVR